MSVDSTKGKSTNILLIAKTVCKSLFVLYLICNIFYLAACKGFIVRNKFCLLSQVLALLYLLLNCLSACIKRLQISCRHTAVILDHTPICHHPFSSGAQLVCDVAGSVLVVQMVKDFTVHIAGVLICKREEYSYT